MLSLSEFWDYSKQAQEKRNPKRILVCCGPGCLARGSETLYKALEKAIEELGRSDVSVSYETNMVGCHGLCEEGPLLIIEPQGILYTGVPVEAARTVVEQTIKNKGICTDLLYQDADGTRYERYEQLPYYRHQHKVALKNTGVVDPDAIHDYISLGGYRGLAKTLEEYSPEEVISMIEQSGLRGRGGAGFPTGRKWRTCANAPGSIRYILANGDEGDPGAFMDRSIMEGDPHSIIEGMIIGAYAIGSSRGYLYVREEYPLAIKRLQQAIDQARTYGFLGESILGQENFSLDLEVRRGGGAFVCGESTALMRSIEGQVGEPRAKYVRSVEKGFYQQPTVLNNVETWCTVPTIITRGPEWFAGLGHEKSRGTKAFSLVGNTVHTGLIEVPMGITLKEIIYDIGGGIQEGGTFKAVQTGGPSGGCLPEHLLNLPVDFEKLEEAGSMMGSGGLIVMDQNTCMVDVARYFITFLLSESCGKCVPCREGLIQLKNLFDGLVQGRGKTQDLEIIEDLAWVMGEGALCGLGSSAPNPVLSTLRYFRGEYLAHIQEKQCPAGVCQALIQYTIDSEICTGCGLCVEACPHDCIYPFEDVYAIRLEDCTGCDACFQVCPCNAIGKG